MKQENIRVPFRMLVLLLGLFLSVGAFAQIDVKGHVKDAQGEPVIGATVRVANTQTASVTDFDGNFTLKAPQGADITVTYVGYQTATVKAARELVITLQEDQNVLENVVVIGYGRAKKNDLTGSVTAMKPDDMSKGITNNASDMLVGKIAGVDVITSGGTPGAGAQIRIRGGASLNASNDPLLIIDGLPISNSTATGMSNVMAMINPNDIESFTVLKDASATAIYGSRASNGVIIITTKKGKKGTSIPHLTYNGDITISTIAKKYDVLNAAQYKSLVAGIEGLDVTQLGDADTNWQDEIFRTSFSNNHSLSMSGSLWGIPYRISGGLNVSKGIVKGSEMDRANIGLNLSPSLLNDHLNMIITAKYMTEKDFYPDASGAIGAALSIDPTRPVYVNDPTYQYVTGGFYQPLINAKDIADPNWTKMTNNNAPQNPVALLDQKTAIARAHDFTGNFDVDYKIHGFEDLHIHATVGGQYTESSQKDNTSYQAYSPNYYGWDGITQYYKYSMTGTAYVKYVKEIGIHNIDIMAAAEESHYHSNGYNYGQGTDPYTGEAHNVALREEQAWATHNTLVSYFGRLDYSLLDRYMLTATYRADGSSKFAKGNKWGYFPAVALAWKINEEPFLKKVNWLNELKLRLSWGKTGQQDIGSDFGYSTLFTISNSYAQYMFGNTPYQTVRINSYNPDLTWEKTTTYDAGLDFGFLNNRITASFDAYYRKTTDLMNTVVIPVGTNFASTLTKNMGSLKNYGVEFGITAKPIVTKDFMWDLSYNVSWNHNEITELTGAGDDDYYVKTGDNISRGNSTKIMANKVGSPANSFFVYQQVYDANGKPMEGVYVDRNGDGKINESDRYLYKKPAADVIMGLTTKFIYKNFDLSASFHASIGNYVYYDFLSDKAAISASGLYSNSAFHNTTPEAVALGFHGVGTEYYLSDYFVRNASYLKCSNITLGYSFPALLQYAGNGYFSGRVYATVQNPFFITKYKGLDPEVSNGIDRNPYPRPLSIQLGINLNF
ncbi:MAG: TonB-dependent receptor [Prevotella sp.]|nr:TonB-dependent receptor [Prevotella sp.]